MQLDRKIPEPSCFRSDLNAPSGASPKTAKSWMIASYQPPARVSPSAKALYRGSPERRAPYLPAPHAVVGGTLSDSPERRALQGLFTLRTLPTIEMEKSDLSFPCLAIDAGGCNPFFNEYKDYNNMKEHRNLDGLCCTCRKFSCSNDHGRYSASPMGEGYCMKHRRSTRSSDSCGWWVADVKPHYEQLCHPVSILPTSG